MIVDGGTFVDLAEALERASTSSLEFTHAFVDFCEKHVDRGDPSIVKMLDAMLATHSGIRDIEQLLRAVLEANLEEQMESESIN